MKKLPVLIVVTLLSLLTVATLLLRSSVVSDRLVRIVLPELSEALGARVEIDRVYLNLIPLFAGVEGLRIYDESGEYSQIPKAKVYVEVLGLLKGEVILKRIVIRGTDLQLTDPQIKRIRESLKNYLAKEPRSAVKAKVRSIVLHGSSVSYTTEGIEVQFKGTNAEVMLADATKGIISVPSARVVPRKGDPLEGRIKTAFYVRDDKIELQTLEILTPDSRFRGSGTMSAGDIKGLFNLELDVVLHEVKRLLRLRGNGEGRVSANGTIEFKGKGTGAMGMFGLDLSVKGDLFLETLMEILKVKEPLKGHVSFHGTIKGSFNDLEGEGKAVLSEGNLFGVKIDRLSTLIGYSKGAMSFSEASGNLYGGSAHAQAVIALPVVNHFSLKVDAVGLNSKGVFELIKWDPMIPEGRVTGNLETAGATFSPQGSFSYKSMTQGPDILGRVREITGTYRMSDDVISLRQMRIATVGSEATAEGMVDLRKELLSFNGDASTSDVRDLSAPYFEGLRGPSRMSFSLGGPLKDPAISLTFRTGKVSFDTASLDSKLVRQGLLGIDSSAGDISYRKNRLTIRRLSLDAGGGKVSFDGKIDFPKARELFQLREPYYDFTVSTKNYALNELAPLISRSVVTTGILTAGFSFRGEHGHTDVKGEVQARSLSVKGMSDGLDEVSGLLSFRGGEYTVRNGRITRGLSGIALNGKVSASRQFSFEMESPLIRLADIGGVLPGRISTYPIVKETHITNVKAIGEGSFDKPLIIFSGDISGNGRQPAFLRQGSFKGDLRGDNLSVSASVLDNKLVMRGAMTLSESLQWSLQVDAEKGRYDNLVRGFADEAPDDLLLSVKGRVAARGDRNHVNVDATVESIYLYSYGNGFSNAGPITAQLRDRNLTIAKATLRNNDTELTVNGDMTIGKSLNLSFEGASALEPLKAVSPQIEALKGRATYVLSITGDWDKPSLNGGLEISRGVLGVRGLPYRITDLAAYCYFDEDTVVLQRATGKVSGGDIRISGTSHIQRFSIKRFSLESEISNVTLSPRSDLWVNLSGNLFYRGNLDAQTLSGDVVVNRAKYTERIDWRSWILSVRSPSRPAGEFTKVDLTNLNVRVKAPSVVVDNNLVRASVGLDIVMRGTVGRPIPFGKVEVADGVVYFRNNEFTLKKGRVDFTNPNRVNPYVDIIAETKIDLYRIRLALNGTPDDFSVVLDSTPSLSETDIVSVLTVGYVDSKSKGLGSGLGAAEATAFLAGKLQDTMDDRLRTVVGLDRIQVEPYVTKKSATVTPRLSVSKKLLGEDLYLTYATTLDTGAEQLWKVEYKLNKHTSLIGMRDERGGLGADIKFRFEFR